MKQIVANNRYGNLVRITEKLVYESPIGAIVRSAHKRLDNGRINYYYTATVTNTKGECRCFNTYKKAYNYLLRRSYELECEK